MKQRKTKITKLFLWLFGFAMVIFTCQKKDDTNKLQTDTEIKTATIKTVSANDIPEVMNFIASKSADYKFVLDDKNTTDGMSRSHEDNLVMTTLITDEITQVTNAYQKSNYTFKLIKQSDLDGKYFLNLVVKEYMDTFYLYIVKYVPDDNWLNGHSITNDFADFTGMVYFYNDQGIYIAKATMVSGSSTATERHPCGDPDDEGNTNDYPIGDEGDEGDNNSGGGGGGETQICISYWEDPDGDTWDEYPADGDNVQEVYLVVDCSGIEDKSMNDFLRHPCEGTGGGGGTPTPSCTPDPNIDCTFPMYWDNTCHCVEPEEIENGDVAVITDKDEFLEFMSDCNVLGNLSNSPSFDQRMQELMANNSGNTEIGYWGRNNSNDNMNYNNADRFESQPNVMQLSPPLPTQSIDSYIHNHSFTTSIGPNGQTITNKPFATFSPADFYTLYLLFNNNLITDPDNFVLTMTSPGPSINNPDDDTVYAVVINNPTDFSTFGALYLWDLEVAENFFSRVGSNSNVSTSLQEKKLAEILKENNLGMTLYRGDRNDLTNWTRIKIKNNGDVQENNCN